MADDEPVSVYDEIEIEDMTYDTTTQMYHYPCPCGDKFEIALVDLLDEADIAVCPSCSLMVRVIFEVVSVVPPFPSLSSLALSSDGGGAHDADERMRRITSPSQRRRPLSRLLLLPKRCPVDRTTPGLRERARKDNTVVRLGPLYAALRGGLASIIPDNR